MHYLTPQDAWPILAKTFGLEGQRVRSLSLIVEPGSVVLVKIERFTTNHELEQLCKALDGVKLVDPPAKEPAE